MYTIPTKLMHCFSNVKFWTGNEGDSLVCHIVCSSADQPLTLPIVQSFLYYPRQADVQLFRYTFRGRIILTRQSDMYHSKRADVQFSRYRILANAHSYTDCYAVLWSVAFWRIVYNVALIVLWVSIFHK